MVLFAANVAQAQDQRIPVDKGFYPVALKMNGGFGKIYDYMVSIKVYGGQLAVCGAGKFPDVTTAQFAKKVLRQTKVVMDGKTLIKDISYFNEVPLNADLTRSEAVCRLTGVKPPSGEDHDISIDYGGARFRD
jgi:hypothetical protein